MIFLVTADNTRGDRWWLDICCCRGRRQACV